MPLREQAEGRGKGSRTESEVSNASKPEDGVDSAASGQVVCQQPTGLFPNTLRPSLVGEKEAITTKLVWHDCRSEAPSNRAARSKYAFERSSDEDSDGDGDDGGGCLPADQQMRRKVEREGVRLGRLVRDKTSPPVFASVGHGAPLVGEEAAECGEQYLMSGALEPDDTRYVPAYPGTGGVMVSEGGYDADSEPAGPSSLAGSGQHQRHASSSVEATRTVDREPPRETGEKQTTTAQQLLANLNRKLTVLPLRWRKKRKSAAAETVDSGMDFCCIGLQSPQDGYDADSERTPTFADSSQQLHASPPPPPPKDRGLAAERVYLGWFGGVRGSESTTGH
ncbi:hypothetical protein LTR08_007307 [Meristemomyces frigidus]|nr:hypothetical protein LTR08_007307 [Meristemomyces frigidus]